MENPLDLTDVELSERCRASAGNAILGFDSYYREVERRTVERQGKAMIGLTRAALVLAIVETISTVIELFL